jgi:hypothetical protein
VARPGQGKRGGFRTIIACRRGSRLKGKARLRSEIVEAVRGLHGIGAVGDAEIGNTTLIEALRSRVDCAFLHVAQIPALEDSRRTLVVIGQKSGETSTRQQRPFGDA